MQGDLIDRFRPCGAQARVGDRHRRNSSRCGVRVKADAAQCAHRKAVRSGDGLLLGEQGQVYCAGIVCFVPQGDALFADRYAAAVGGKPRDGRVRARQLAGDAVLIGAQYTQVFGKKHEATLGIVFSPGHDLNNDSYVEDRLGNAK